MGACTTVTRTVGVFTWCMQLLVCSTVIGHGRMHSLSGQTIRTMHVPFLSRSGHKRLAGRLLRTTMNLCRT